MGILTLTLTLLVLLFLAAFFVVCDTVIRFISLSQVSLLSEDNRQADFIAFVKNQSKYFLTFTLIGTIITNGISFILVTLISQTYYSVLGVVWANACLALILLLFTHILPKTLATMYPIPCIRVVSLPLKMLQSVFSPLIYFINLLAQFLLRISGLATVPDFKPSYVSQEMTPSYNKLVQNISTSDFKQITVEDIMIPKADIVGVDLGQPWLQTLEQLEIASYTRLPVYRGTIDHLEGTIHTRQILTLALENKLDLENLVRFIEEPYFIPEETPMQVQLFNFKKMKKKSAFVVDEYGDILGLVTVEDLLQELVGEFTKDIDTLSSGIIPQEDGSVIIDASLTVRHLNRIMDWQLPLIGPKTLSGLIIEYLGYIPPAESCLTMGEYRLEILKVSDNTIKGVKIIRIKNI